MCLLNPETGHKLDTTRPQLGHILERRARATGAFYVYMYMYMYICSRQVGP